jgi:hypothetical protein
MAMGSLLRAAFVMTAVGLAALSQDAAVAKGPLAAIEIAGPALDHTLAVTEGDALLDFNPWGQAFLGEKLDEAPAMTDALTVTMFVDDGAGGQRAAYRFRYQPGSDGGRIHLPGPGEPDYDLNKTTILDGSGASYESSAAWDAFFESLIAIRPPSTGSGGLK